MGSLLALGLLSGGKVGFGLAHAWQGRAGMIATGVGRLAYGAVYLASGRQAAPGDDFAIGRVEHAVGSIAGDTEQIAQQRWLRL